MSKTIYDEALEDIKQTNARELFEYIAISRRELERIRVLKLKTLIREKKMTSKEALETIKEIELDEYKGYKTVDYLYKEEIEILEQALEKAQKQEQLLELYKELVREIKDYMLGNINDIDYSKSVLKVNNLDKQIKELENE